MSAIHRLARWSSPRARVWPFPVLFMTASLAWAQSTLPSASTQHTPAAVVVQVASDTLPLAAPARWIGISIFDAATKQLVSQLRSDAAIAPYRAKATGDAASVSVPIPDGYVHRELLVRVELELESGQVVVVDEVRAPLEPAVDSSLGPLDGGAPAMPLMGKQASFASAVTGLLDGPAGDKSAKYEAIKEEWLGSSKEDGQ